MAEQDIIRFSKENGEYIETTRYAIENMLEANYDNPDNPWRRASVDEVIEDAKDTADESLLLYILADMLKDNGGLISSTLSIRGEEIEHS